jgi:citrate lyase subunit gamma (acyl carrier protein)
MEIKSIAQAGTFESSDILIMVEPARNGREIDIDSSVLIQYQDLLLKEINTVLDKYDIADIHLIAKDKGALSCTIVARTETAVLRSIGLQKGTGYGTN